MKKLLFVCALLLVHTCIFAQFKTIAESKEFEEPETGFTRILQMKDGRTVFFHFTVKDGINMRFYDAAHKEKQSRNIQASFGKLKKAKVNGIFEIGGDIVAFVSELDGKHPVLYRLILDSKTGKLKKEDKIAELERMRFLQRRSTFFSYNGMRDFIVKKDPESENYAVAIYSLNNPDVDKRLEFIHYGPDNTELSRIYFVPPAEYDKRFSFFDFVVLGSEKLCILADLGKKAVPALVTVEKGSKGLVIDKLKFPSSQRLMRGVMKYNPVTKKLVMFTFALLDGKGLVYTAHLAQADPYARTSTVAREVNFSDINKKSREIFGKKGDFEASPQNLFIHNDGTFTVVMEEVEVQIITRSNSSGSINTILGNIGINHYTHEGALMSSYFVTKKHFLPAMELSAMYHAAFEREGQALTWADQYKSFSFVNGPVGQYVLLNDVEENTAKLKKGNQTKIIGVAECDTYFYRLQGKDVLLPREPLFGSVEKGNNHNLAVNLSADYMPALNSYVTLKLEIRGRRKKVKLVWMEPS